MGRLVAQSWDLGSRLVFKRSRVRIPEPKTRWKIIAIVKKVKRKDNYIRRDQIIFFWFVNSDQMPGLFVQYLAIYDIEKLPKKQQIQSRFKTLQIAKQTFKRLPKSSKNSPQCWISAKSGHNVSDQNVSLLSQGTIPTVWRKISYPSQSSLWKYLTDLSERIDFFKGWIQKGKPESFWLGGFFFPQSFLTAILQNFARKNSVTVDQVGQAFLHLNPILHFTIP